MNEHDLTSLSLSSPSSFICEDEKMNMVRVSGKIGLTSLWISLVTYFVSLILYLISFCLPDWIIYQTIPIKIGIWRLCDIEV